jgi:hypothetical protein
MSTTCPWSGGVLAASALSFAAGVLGAARFPTRASATSIANIDSFVTVALFGGIGLLLSLSVWSQDPSLPDQQLGQFGGSWTRQYNLHRHVRSDVQRRPFHIRQYRGGLQRSRLLRRQRHI